MQVDPKDSLKCVANDAYVVVSVGNVIRGFDIKGVSHDDAIPPVTISGRFRL